MPTEEELFAAVDALLEGEPQLPPPAERARLREAAGVTQARLAQVLQSTTQTVKNWEAGRSEPRPPRREAYLRLLEGWAAKYPAPDQTDPAPAPAVPETFAAAPAAPRRPAGDPQDSAPPVLAPAAPSSARPSATARSSVSTRPTSSTSTSRRPARKAAAPAADPRFPHGPLAVLDGDGSAYCVEGVVLDCPATTIPQLVEWTLKESGLGAPRLNRNGKDADPLIVLTEAAAVRLGLPACLEDRRGLRLPEDHLVVKQLTRAKWKLTQRGFGPWARIYRPAQGGQRSCVQLAVLPWGALDARAWGDAGQLPAPELARVLGVYATRVTTPRGSAAVCGLELMTSLRPPTRAAKDASGVWVSAPNPGALTQPVDPAPPEAPAEHPVAQGWEGGFLDEEAYQWTRDVATLSDEECLLPWAVGLDINTAFLAAASRLVVGLGAPVHVSSPVFDKKIPGSWLVDLSHIELDPRLPSPFTPSGRRPDGPAWYATPTVAYAVELGYDVRPVEAFLRYETGAYLDPWHDRLKDAYAATMADLGVPVGKDTDERAFLAAMEHLGQNDPGLACVLSAIKATVKGGIGKLRERPQGRHYRDGERWPALERPTWRPDIRAAVISKARVNMHRKMLNTAKATGRYPLAVLSDCVVYASPEPSPLGFLPLTGDGHVLPGSFRLGATPGLAKTEGVQPMLTAVEWLEKGLNPARHIKGGDAVLDEGE
ncbi:helix-turn-helix domain-containing protein [Streptomyces sp. SBST2-5]|uniref:Helix-turn-helix domain-containing protein n=1 Tax=Streptomyces composti TaxID=2720025 RepID=A0ABX1AJD6_9ACTN|nr:helix-turn-helix domain-containing protein [Streptomyces composti]NJP53798.1 helix-turn-helix domain-containing protein [Streptomyces composti]